MYTWPVWWVEKDNLLSPYGPVLSCPISLPSLPQTQTCAKLGVRNYYVISFFFTHGGRSVNWSAFITFCDGRSWTTGIQKKKEALRSARRVRVSHRSAHLLSFFFSLPSIRVFLYLAWLSTLCPVNCEVLFFAPFLWFIFYGAALPSFIPAFRYLLYLDCKRNFTIQPGILFFSQGCVGGDKKSKQKLVPF